MDVKSVKGLEQVVEQVEALVARLENLDRQNGEVRIPKAPVPLTLETTKEWVTLAEEYCRKPRIAASKEFLESKGIATASIPSTVLENPDAITRIIEIVESCPCEFHEPAFVAVGSALTKGFEDADTVVGAFRVAAEELSELDDPVGEKLEWVRTVATNDAAVDPHDVSRIVEDAKEVCELCEVAQCELVKIDAFATLEEARDVLSRFNQAAQKYGNKFIEEGLEEDERTTVTGIDVTVAASILEKAWVDLIEEKNDLENEANSLKRQLAMTGADWEVSASTIAELRQIVQNGKRELARKRQELQASLGETIFEVVDSISRNEMPSQEQISDESFGAAIRKAVECGYRLNLEAPREVQ